jgi:hypothetical protein
MSKASREAKEAFQPRRVAVSKGQFRLAEFGEGGGTRYSMKHTTIEQMGEFGLAVSGYFSHLYGLVLVCLFMSAISIPSMVYFESEAYRPLGSDPVPSGLFGSGVCTSTKKVQVTLPDGSHKTATQNLCPFSQSLGYLGMASIIGVGE